ncbi:MAG: hypothetical protein LUH21_04750 [Clostridiales bacterium]|nr:hypothetical protein [Clostridiales bacterium]
MKFELTQVWGFNHAVHGMRNPMNSWNKSDSNYCTLDDSYDCNECLTNNNCPLNLSAEDHAYVIGANDMKLAQQLIRAGSEHRKFLRQIFVSVDITAPMYWWAEFDTYKVGTVANSTSKMHKLSTTPITLECFETDDYDGNIICGGDTEYPLCAGVEFEETFINRLEFIRKKYLETKDKRYWKELLRWLPESWLQTRTVTLNYENIYSMIRQRKNHKLNEWSGKDDDSKPNFISWAKTLPYADDFLFLDCE